MARPTIVIVPGLWEGPTVFDGIAGTLRQSGFDVRVAQLVSTGTVSPGNPSMKDDVAAIHGFLQPLAEAGKEIVLVLHSAGGFLGSEAMEGLDQPGRQAAGQQGGVVKIIFLAAGVAPKGYEHQPLPFAEDKDGAMYCKNIEEAFFHDVPEAETTNALAGVKTQPAEGWRATSTFCGWEVVPSVYVIAKLDKIIPEAMQQQLAGMAGSSVVESVDAGHMLFLSKPAEVVQLIEKHAMA